MKIKIKVKTIILVLLSLILIYLVLIPFASLEIARTLDKKQSNKARVFYDSFLSKSYIWNESRALYEYASGIIGSEEKFQLMLGGWGGGNNKTIEDLEKGAQALEKILYKKNKSRKDIKYSLLAYPKLLNTYIQLQAPNELLAWINWGKEEDHEKLNYLSALYEAYYHIVNRDYRQAEKAIAHYQEDMEVLDYRYYFLKGEIALRQDEGELAKLYYEKGSLIKDNLIEKQANFFASPVYQYRNYWLEGEYDLIKGPKKIKGKVSFDGQPMPFVEIYVQKKETGVSFRSLSGDLLAITDINGEFETIGLREGQYDIGLGMASSLLLNKAYQRPDLFFIDIGEVEEFNFTLLSPFELTLEEDIVSKENSFNLQWEEVPGADYYMVGISGDSNPFGKESAFISIYINDKNSSFEIKDSWAQFDINKLNILSSFFTSMDMDGKISPSSILGIFHGKNDYYLSVNAYDKDSKLINSSVGIWAYFDEYKKLTIDRELSPGEDLISKKKYEEAIDYYQDIINREPDKSEALLYLSQLYHKTYLPKDRNYDKILNYSQKYDALNPDSLLSYYLIMDMDKESMRDYKDLVKGILDKVLAKGNDRNVHYYLGNYYLSMRDYDLARENFQKSQYFTDDKILYIDLYEGNIGAIIEKLDRKEFNFSSINEFNLVSDLEKIDSSLIESYDYQLLREMLGQILSEDEENRKIYNNYIYKIDNPILKSLLNQIAKEEGWNRSYRD